MSRLHDARLRSAHASLASPLIVPPTEPPGRPEADTQREKRVLQLHRRLSCTSVPTRLLLRRRILNNSFRLAGADAVYAPRHARDAGRPDGPNPRSLTNGGWRRRIGLLSEGREMRSGATLEDLAVSRPRPCPSRDALRRGFR